MKVKKINPRRKFNKHFNHIRKSPGNYYVSSLVGKTDGMQDKDRIILDPEINLPKARDILSDNQKRHYVILPVYETINTPPEGVKYQVRYISINKDMSVLRDRDPSENGAMGAYVPE